MMYEEGASVIVVGPPDLKNYNLGTWTKRYEKFINEVGIITAVHGNSIAYVEFKGGEVIPMHISTLELDDGSGV